MPLDLTPLSYNWRLVTAGDTFPAINFTETASDADLIRVRLKVADSDGNEVLSLDSDTTGITINTATAGAWDFNVGPITNVQTGNLAAGCYQYDLKTTDAAGTVSTEFRGTWEIL